MIMMIEISVIIPTYNRKDLLIRLVNSLYNSECSKELYEVVIIDDGSSDGTTGALKHLSNSYPNFFYKRIENSGPGIARNIGVGLARGRIIAFMDDDCVVTKSWLKEIKKTFELDKDTEVIYGRILPEKDFYPPFSHSWNVDGQHIMICNIALKKEIFHKIGGLDLRLSFWAEDWDFIAKLKENNIQINYNPNLVAIHSVSYKGFHLKDYLYTPSFWLRHDYLFSKYSVLPRKPFQEKLLKRNIIKITIIFLILLAPLGLNYISRFFLLFIFIFLRNAIKVIRLDQRFRGSDIKIKSADAIRYIFTSWLVDPINLILFFRHRLFKKFIRQSGY